MLVSADGESKVKITREVEIVLHVHRLRNANQITVHRLRANDRIRCIARRDEGTEVDKLGGIKRSEVGSYAMLIRWLQLWIAHGNIQWVCVVHHRLMLLNAWLLHRRLVIQSQVLKV